MSSTVHALSTLAIALGGLAIIAKRRPLGFRLIAVALILLAADAVIADRGGDVGLFHSISRLLSWLTVGGLCLAILSGAGALRSILLALVGVLVWQMVVQALASAPIWIWPLLALILAVALPIIALRAIRSVVALLFGDEAAGHLIGVWLVRALDALGRAFAGPVRRRFGRDPRPPRPGRRGR